MLKFDSITLRRGPLVLIEDFSAVLLPKQKLGLVGANGSGKTSLLALILGDLDADLGELEIPEDFRISHMAQESPGSMVSSRDYVLEGDKEYCRLTGELQSAETEARFSQIAELHDKMAAIDGYNAKSRAEQLLHGLGFKTADLTRPVDDFSGGWKMRLNLAQCLMSPSDLLLLDEPTNHLDLDAILWLSGWLRKYQGSLILISHDREFLDEITDSIASLENRKLTLYKGNYSAFEKQKAAKLALHQASFRKQQAQVKKMQDFVRRFRAKASKAKQAQSRLKALSKLEIIGPAHVDSPFSFQIIGSDRASDPLLQLIKADLGYTTPILEAVTLSIRPGDRIGLLGANGAGKSTLIKTLAAELPMLSGHREEGLNLKTGYFSQQHLDQLDPMRSPFDHMHKLDSKLSDHGIRNYLGGFDFRGDKALMKVEKFSGGEKARLSLAMVTYLKPNLLLLDEPTNHLDLEMRHALTQGLQSFEGAMLLVSHDRHLLNNTVEQFLIIKDNKVLPFDGNLTDYQQIMAMPEPSSKSGTKNARSADSMPNSSVAKSAYLDRRKLKSSVITLEKRLKRLNEKMAEVNEKLSDPDLYNNPENNLQSLLRDQISLKDEIEKTEHEWLVQSELIDQSL